MKLNIYAVKDTVVGEMGNPFYLNNDEMAKRSFKNAINNGTDIQLKLNYADTQLYKIGTWDTVTGEIESNVEFIMNGTEAKV